MGRLRSGARVWWAGLVGGVLLAGAAGAGEASVVTTTLGVVAGPLTLAWPTDSRLRADLDERGMAAGELGTALVVDARGTGEGWRLRIAASRLEAPGGLAVEGAE